MKIKTILLFILLINLYGCVNQPGIEDSLGTFDISKDDKKILFSYKKVNKSSIYSMNIDGTNIRSIIEAKNGKNFVNPRYSNDKKKILFIESSMQGQKNSSLCIASPDGNNIIKVVNELGVITEAFFRSNVDEIIFCKANEYKKYSPIGRKMPHDFDIYSINLTTGRLVRLTNISAYSINHITEIDGKITFNLKSNAYNGIFTLSEHNIVPFISNGKFKDKIVSSAFLFLPEKKEIIYVDSYDLFKMNTKTKKSTFLIKSDFGIVSLMRRFNNSKKILCSMQNDTNLYILDNNLFSKSVISINL
ncbi:TolB family protein [Flavobacterium sp. LAR06]|uniref:TolB family protein n=1 Tax=Flavobacterium sp. LAR06 TaxID=3064897 RepID=UPI0035C05536